MRFVNFYKIFINACRNKKINAKDHNELSINHKKLTL